MLRLDCTVIIDPNVRVRGNQTYSGLEEVRMDNSLGGDWDWVAIPPSVGDTVMVLEEESGAETTGIITDRDAERGLIFLKIDWKTLQVPDAS